MNLSPEEQDFLYGGLPINSSVMAKSVPNDRLRQLLDLRIFLRDIAEAKPENFLTGDPFEGLQRIASDALITLRRI